MCTRLRHGELMRSLASIKSQLNSISQSLPLENFIPINETLAEAIIDMDNKDCFNHSEGVGPDSVEKYVEWDKLVAFVTKKFKLQSSCRPSENV